jgi:hypothetical protein
VLVVAFGRSAPGVSRTVRWTARALFAGFAAAVAILLVVGAFAEAAFALIYGVGFGTFAWYLRGPLQGLAPSGRWGRLLAFVVLSVTITVTEELLVVALGGRVAQAVLWVDLLWVGVLWLVWQLAWYRADAVSRFDLSPAAAIVIAGATGVLFEVVLSRLLFLAPLEGLVLAPIAWVIYSAVFTLPSALIGFPGPSQPTGRTVTAAVLAPFLLAVAGALPLFFLLRLVGIPLH